MNQILMTVEGTIHAGGIAYKEKILLGSEPRRETIAEARKLIAASEETIGLGYFRAVQKDEALAILNDLETVLNMREMLAEQKGGA